MKKLAILGLTLLIGLSMAQDLGGRTVLVGSDTTYPPFESVSESGEIVGFDVDVVNAVCERINCVAEFTTYAWDGIVAAIGAGTFQDFDMVASGVTITEERDETVDFSSPYVTVSQSIATTTANEAYTLEDFTGEGSELTLGTQLGTTNYELAVDLIGEDRVVSYDDFNSTVLALLQGDIDGMIVDDVSAAGFLAQYPGEMVTNISGLTSGEALGFVFEPGDELLDAFNAGLQMIEEDGTLEALRAEWFGN